MKIDNRITFEEAYVSEEYDTTTYYFTTDKSLLEELFPNQYPEADAMEISIEFPSRYAEANMASVMISPTENGSAFDWNDIDIPYDEIEALFRIAEASLNQSIYAIVGYDKDHDVYEVIETHSDLKYLMLKGKDIAELQKDTDEFRRNGTGEPFDWFVICDVKDADYPEHYYWASYQDRLNGIAYDAKENAVLEVDSVILATEGVIYSVSVGPDYFVDVKTSAENPGLVYIMQNEDGSTVYHRDGTSISDYSYDENKALQIVKDIYSYGKTNRKNPFLKWPWEGFTEKQKQVADFLAFEAETSIVYPFAVTFENVTEKMVDDIMNRCTSWDMGNELLSEDIYDACEKVLGINLELCGLQKEKPPISDKIQDAKNKISIQQHEKHPEKEPVR